MRPFFVPQFDGVLHVSRAHLDHPQWRQRLGPRLHFSVCMCVCMCVYTYVCIFMVACGCVCLRVVACGCVWLRVVACGCVVVLLCC